MKNSKFGVGNDNINNNRSHGFFHKYGGSFHENKTLTTIPPHLIPLGPDGTPLLTPDGSPIRSNRFPFTPVKSLNDKRNQNITDRFPFLAHFTTTRVPVRLSTSTEASVVDDRDFMTRMIHMVRELPMDTRRRMLAGMMFAMPMAVSTLATVGVPTLMIAPLATIIPSFLFAAFTETDQQPSSSESHGHRTGLAGLVDAVRIFRSRNNTGSSGIMSMQQLNNTMLDQMTEAASHIPNLHDIVHNVFG